MEALRGAGLFLYLVTGVFAGASLGMSPMPQAQMISGFWVLVGLNYYLVTIGERAGRT